MDLVGEGREEAAARAVVRAAVDAAVRARQEDRVDLARVGSRAVDDGAAADGRRRRLARGVHDDTTHLARAARRLLGDVDTDELRWDERLRARLARRIQQVRPHLLCAHPTAPTAVKQGGRVIGDKVGQAAAAEETPDGVAALKNGEAIGWRVKGQLRAAVRDAVRAIRVHCATANANALSCGSGGPVPQSTLRSASQEAISSPIHGEDVVTLGGALLEQVDAVVHERGHGHVL